ncbi:SMI1 / KNR4 family protein [Gimesia panareensis]|uniref:SMI1 / KNR4 family protein n=1 Tax=Gimesia panareensis TaxID=2527978 RepID=A0A517QCN8_9PLAN|nr:SMI1/KNR4 family protein [Gimesia panareensis]QDT29397.1 SMI1 / KNR4 family protein [Gimesia panareensis]
MDKNFCHVLFRDVNPSVSTSDILNYEQSFSISLPKDYFDFLLKINGGSPIPSAYKEPDLEDFEGEELPPGIVIPDQIQSDLLKYTISPSRIDHFLGLNPASTENLEALTIGTKYTTKDDASSLLLIAFDKVGTPIYLSLSDEKKGWIYDFEEDIDFGLYDPGEATPLSELDHLVLAKSFREFVESLFPARVHFAKNFQPTEKHLDAIRQSGTEDP